MRIANPIYDVVFKYLLDDEKDKALEEKDQIIADLERRLRWQNS